MSSQISLTPHSGLITESGYGSNAKIITRWSILILFWSAEVSKKSILFFFFFFWCFLCPAAAAWWYWLETNIHSFYSNLGWGLRSWECECGSVLVNAGHFLAWMCGVRCEWEAEEELWADKSPTRCRRQRIVLPSHSVSIAIVRKKSLPSRLFFFPFFISVGGNRNTCCISVLSFRRVKVHAAKKKKNTKRKPSMSAVTLMAKYRRASQQQRYLSQQLLIKPQWQNESTISRLGGWLCS